MNSGVLTNSVETTVCSLAALGDVAEVAVDKAASELVGNVLESEVAAAALVGLEAGDADRVDEAGVDVECAIRKRHGQPIAL